jgi:hypothetical protein
MPKKKGSNPSPPTDAKPRPSSPPPPVPRAVDDHIVVKIVQAVRPGDVLVIECDELHTQPQLEHLHKQLKAKLPDVRIVILNKGAHLANAQTIATLAGAKS